MPRCFDCLAEFDAEGEPFAAVLKQMREFPADVDPEEARLLHSTLFDQVLVCEDCARWYGDQAVWVGSLGREG